MSQEKEPTISFIKDGKEETVRIVQVGKDVTRLAIEDANRLPFIQKVIKQDEVLNNVWLIQKGKVLLARVRVKKKETGRFFITATVTLGVVVIAKAIHDHTRNSE